MKVYVMENTIYIVVSHTLFSAGSDLNSSLTFDRCYHCFQELDQGYLQWYGGRIICIVVTCAVVR